MRVDKEPLHLRLVHTTSAPAVEPMPQPPPEQLAFPYPERDTIVFLDTTGIDRSAFVELIRNMAPRWVIDARAVPRMDVLTGSRSDAFELFNKMRSEYVDLFGRMQVKSYSDAGANPALWGPTFENLVSEPRKDGPFLFLFDNIEIMRAADKAVSKILTSLTGRRLKTSIVS